METINNIAGAASKAIWGETAPAGQSGQEPISGERGAGTINEPYDRGNEEGRVASSSAPTTSTTTNPDLNKAQSHDRPVEKQQGAERPGDVPGPEDSHAVRKTKEEAESAQHKPKVPHTDEEREEAMKSGEFPHDPNDHSGEPLKVHDGPAKKDRRDSVAHEGGGPHGKKLGTGEEYVKSSGLAADGGDFDVTKPGAGREANRFMEEKGIHKSVDDKASSNSDLQQTPSPSGGSVGKESKLNRLKEKLHIKH